MVSYSRIRYLALLVAALFLTSTPACHKEEAAAPGSQIETLKAKLVSTDEEDRNEAIDELGDMGSQAVSALTPLLSDSDAAVRRRVISALAKVGADALDPLSRTVSDDKDPEVRLHATLALGALWNKPQQVMPVLVKALDDPSKWVRVAAAEVLTVVGDPTVIPSLEAKLQDPEPVVRTAMSEAITRLRSE